MARTVLSDQTRKQARKRLRKMNSDWREGGIRILSRCFPLDFKQAPPQLLYRYNNSDTASEAQRCVCAVFISGVSFAVLWAHQTARPRPAAPARSDSQSLSLISVFQSMLPAQPLLIMALARRMGKTAPLTHTLALAGPSLSSFPLSAAASLYSTPRVVC